MGVVSSSCENCFGGKPDSGQSRLNPNSRPKRDKSDELKTDYHVSYQTDFRVSNDAPRSLNTVHSRSPIRLKNKHNKHISTPKSGMGEDFHNGRKSKKPTKVSIEDFEIKKVRILSLDSFVKMNRFSAEELLEKFVWYKKREKKTF